MCVCLFATLLLIFGTIMKVYIILIYIGSVSPYSFQIYFPYNIAVITKLTAVLYDKNI